MLSWERTEYLLKGLYLGLLVLVALLAKTREQVALVGAIMFGFLGFCLLIAAVRKLREGYRVKGRPISFLIFLLLENPGLVYTGIVVGLAGGTYLLFAGILSPAGMAQSLEDDWYLLIPVAGGILLGLIFWNLREMSDRKQRNWGGLLLVFFLSLGALLFSRNAPEEWITRHERVMIGALMLLGIPGFYLLAFSSLVEESEVEMAGLCSALGIGLAFLGDEYLQQAASISLAFPLIIYFLYTRAILPGLRVFKHALRGASYARVGRHRPALAALNRALQLNPGHETVHAQLWDLHRNMNIDQLKNDPETLALVNYELCLERVAALLLADRPTPEMIQEARRLLELVSIQRPNLEPRCAYWRAVASLHEKRFDEAQHDLEQLLTPPARDSGQRRGILLQAWHLALLLHPEMKRRVGEPQLALPGRRMEAIAAVERQLRVKPEDATAWELKRMLYPDLTEEEYEQAVQSLADAPVQEPPAPASPGFSLPSAKSLIPKAKALIPSAKSLLESAKGLLSKKPSTPAPEVSPAETSGTAAVPPPRNVPRDFDHGYAEQLGMAMAAQKENWHKGCAFLRIAARGQPAKAPVLLIHVGRAHERFGDSQALWDNYLAALRAGKAVGVANLSSEDKVSLFAIVKLLGDHMMKEERLDVALEAFKFYSQYDKAGAETWRTLAELFERQAKEADKHGRQDTYQDALMMALHCTEHALSYTGFGGDKDLLERKDRYFYSITAEEVKKRWENIRLWFDVDSCLTKAKQVLERYNGDLDSLEWASHLITLAAAAWPQSLQVKYVKARLHRLKGEAAEAIAILEEVRQNKPEKFASAEEREAWFYIHRLLGEYYIDEKADQAVLCFNEFRNFEKSGADTMYNLGRAYENLGDFPRAAKCYEAVTGYESHPRYYDARDGLERVRTRA